MLPILFFISSCKFKKIIKDKRVLVLGSGPSAKDLKNIPDDVLILTCNYSPKILIKNKIKRKLDLFLAPNSLTDDKEFIPMIKKHKIDLVVVYSPKNKETNHFLKNYKNIFNRFVCSYFPVNTYLKKIMNINPGDFNDSGVPWNSSGVVLLQMAYYYKAKEIYLSGIDMNLGGYFYKRKFDSQHLDIDDYFIKNFSKKAKNVFTISKKSPIVKYFPYKELK